MLKVTGSYYKGCPGKMYLKNGDPGDPPEPPEFEIEKIELNGQDITDFFDGLAHMRIINKKSYYDDCYMEIEDMCINEIEEDACDELKRKEG
jgi:hypothetical protein